MLHAPAHNVTPCAPQAHIDEVNVGPLETPAELEHLLDTSGCLAILQHYFLECDSLLLQPVEHLHGIDG